MSDNTQQIEYWNGPAGQRWAELQESTDRTLSMITAALFPFVAAKPGERILDVGCGCGSTTLALAKIAGAGNVAGVDISAPMLGVARARAAQAGAGIDFTEADASVHAFRPDRDLVFSRFGVMFFADPAAAFANIRKSLRSGGRLAFVCWSALQENGWAGEPLMAVRDLLPPQEPMDPTAPGPFAFADATRVKNILSQAGFSGIHIEPLNTVANMGPSLGDAVQTSLSIGPLARATADLDEETKARLRERLRGVLSRHETPAGITPPAACWLVGAKN
jgi:SAM-dependent methyltransferase